MESIDFYFSKLKRQRRRNENLKEDNENIRKENNLIYKKNILFLCKQYICKDVLEYVLNIYIDKN